MTGLNRRRELAGLKPIRVVEYNLLINRAKFEDTVRRTCVVEAFSGLGFYIYMSRVFHPIFVAPQEPHHAHRINEVASQLQQKSTVFNDFADSDYAGIYVLRKR